MAHGTHKNKLNTSMTGPWFLDVQHDNKVAPVGKVRQKMSREFIMHKRVGKDGRQY